MCKKGSKISDVLNNSESYFFNFTQALQCYAQVTGNMCVADPFNYLGKFSKRYLYFCAAV